MSSDAQSLLADPNSYADMRGLLGAGTSSLVIGTSSGEAADGTTTTTANTAASNATTALANAAAAQSTANTAQSTATAAQSTADAKLTSPAGGSDGAPLVKSGVGAAWASVVIDDLITSSVVDQITYSATAPTGSATNGVLVLVPIS